MCALHHAASWRGASEEEAAARLYIQQLYNTVISHEEHKPSVVVDAKKSALAVTVQAATGPGDVLLPLFPPVRRLRAIAPTLIV